MKKEKFRRWKKRQSFLHSFTFYIFIFLSLSLLMCSIPYRLNILFVWQTQWQKGDDIDGKKIVFCLQKKYERTKKKILLIYFSRLECNVCIYSNWMKRCKRIVEQPNEQIKQQTRLIKFAHNMEKLFYFSLKQLCRQVVNRFCFWKLCLSFGLGYIVSQNIHTINWVEYDEYICVNIIQAFTLFVHSFAFVYTKQIIFMFGGRTERWKKIEFYALNKSVFQLIMCCVCLYK